VPSLLEQPGGVAQVTRTACQRWRSPSTSRGGRSRAGRRRRRGRGDRDGAAEDGGGVVADRVVGERDEVDVLAVLLQRCFDLPQEGHVRLHGFSTSNLKVASVKVEAPDSDCGEVVAELSERERKAVLVGGLLALCLLVAFIAHAAVGFGGPGTDALFNIWIYNALMMASAVIRAL
jgi:hypothetical protein